MKKWLALAVIALLIAGGWYYLRTYYRVEPSWNEAKFGKISKTDIRVPITAAGIIEPYQKIDIKPEASGQVIGVPIKEGDFVREGTVLCVIKKEDEQRNVDRAQARLDQVTAQLKQARATVKSSAAAIEAAKARFKQVTAQGRMVEFDYKKQKELDAKKLTNEQDMINAEARYEMNQADQTDAAVSIKSAEARLEESEAQVASAEAGLKDAQKQLDDAKTHLDRTDVISRANAIVTNVLVKEGNIVQSGSSGITGGSLLMQLGDVSQLKVVTRVDEADIGRVRDITPIDKLPDMPDLRKNLANEEAAKLAKRIGKVKLTVDAFPELTFEGRIDRVDPEGRLNTGSSIIQYDVQVVVTDERRYMLPLGAQAQVEFTVENVKDATAIPAEAVKAERGLRGVFVKTPPPPGSNRKFGKKFIACRFGITDGSVTEVVSSDEPLTAGMDVFTKLPIVKEEEGS